MFLLVSDAKMSVHVYLSLKHFDSTKYNLGCLKYQWDVNGSYKQLYAVACLKACITSAYWVSKIL